MIDIGWNSCYYLKNETEFYRMILLSNHFTLEMEVSYDQLTFC